MLLMFRQINIVFISLLFIAIFSISCQQAKEIPAQVSEDLPNPVEDFTQKDRYKLGLRWYQQSNFVVAKKMWTPLARSGDCDSQYALGVLYFNGLGVRRNRNTALSWWSRAANQEQPQALYSLGIVYAYKRIPYTSLDCRKGCGEPKNLVEAYKWFGIAQDTGSAREIEYAEKSLKQISAEMTSDQITEAQNLIDNWEPEPSRCKSQGLYIINSRFLYN